MVDIKFILDSCLKDIEKNVNKEDLNIYIFMLQNNISTQKILSYIVANRIVEGALMAPNIKDNEQLFYEHAIELKTRIELFQDMISERYKYLPISLYILEDELKDICINRNSYEKMLTRSWVEVQKLESSLYSRALLCI